MSIFKTSTRFRCVYAFLFSAISFAANSQCTINSKSEICIGEVISFSHSFSGAQSVTGYDWDLDGSTSANNIPSTSYSTAGTRNIRLTLTLSDGTKCTTNKTITIFHLPDAGLVIDSVSYFCLSKNNICIRDTSKPGKSGNALFNRYLLWGSGASRNEAYPNASGICYTYLFEGKYTIIMEVKDIKGCVSRVTRDVVILPDLVADLYTSTAVEVSSCKNLICLENSSLFDSVLYKTHTWVIDSTRVKDKDLKKYCFDASVTDTFKIGLIMEYKNGCKDSFFTSVKSFVPQFYFDIDLPNEVCIGTSFLLQNKKNNTPYDEAAWSVRDSASGIGSLLTVGTTFNFASGQPGKYYFTHVVKKNGCVRSWVDSVAIMGPNARFKALNSKQCVLSDTVYFCDSSDNGYRSYNVIRFWDFHHGDLCTTDIKKGTNIYKNCRFSNGINERHYYSLDSGEKGNCFQPELLLLDTVTKCESKFISQVLIGTPNLDSASISNTVKQPCTDIKKSNLTRAYSFEILGIKCNDSWKSTFLYDSLDRTSIAPFAGKPKDWIYDTIFSNDGFITVGIIYENGDQPKYSACGKPTGTRFAGCYDTAWFHNNVFINVEPNAKFGFSPKQGCIPQSLTFKWLDTVQYGMYNGYFDYGDGTKDTFTFNSGDSLMPLIKKTYNKSGIFIASAIVFNSAGCYNSYSELLKIGYFNKFSTDTTICKGSTLDFYDSVYYFGSQPQDTFWRDTGRYFNNLERIWWDFGDGGGISWVGPKASHKYDDTGIFSVKMYSKDSGTCVDIQTKKIYVSGATANIKTISDTFVCYDNYIQFFDNTKVTSYFGLDSVASWDWAFGDTGKYYTKDPTYLYKSAGIKVVRLAVKTLNDCADTVYKQIFIKGPRVGFAFVSDSIDCTPLETIIKNTSKNARFWNWFVVDSTNTNVITTDKDTDFRQLFVKPGTYKIRLVANDTIYDVNSQRTVPCSDTSAYTTIIVQPYLKVAFTHPPVICPRQEFEVVSNSDTLFRIFEWDFGDGVQVFETTGRAKHAYQNAGIYILKFKPVYLPPFPYKQCYDSATDSIFVIPIDADFSIDASGEPVFHFNNLSSNAVRYEWDFGDVKNNSSTETHPSHSYENRKGDFKVILYAWNDLGCPDTVVKFLKNTFEPYLFIPNIFTPEDGDTVNARFDIDGRGIEKYDLVISNRWGEVVFKNTIDGKGMLDANNWNGRKFNSGNICPEGEYYVVFKYKLIGNEESVYYGSVTILRGN